MITDRPTHHRLVLLLPRAAIILAIRAAPSKGDPLLLAVSIEMGVDEFAAMIRIDAQQRKWYPRSDLFDGFKDPYLRFVGDRWRLGPRAEHVGHPERTRKPGLERLRVVSA